MRIINCCHLRNFNARKVITLIGVIFLTTYVQLLTQSAKIKDNQEDRIADNKSTEAEDVEATQMVLKPWILATGNGFIRDPAERYVRPESNPDSDFPFVQSDFDDTSWENVNLPEVRMSMTYPHHFRKC